MNAKAMLGAIERGDLADVYLLWGEDAAAIQGIVKALRRSLFDAGKPGAGLEAFNHERFDAPYVKAVNEVLTACAQMPMMAPRRLVELSAPEDFYKHVQGESTRDKAIEALIDYIGSAHETCTLVITSAGIKGTSKLVKAAKKVAKQRPGKVLELKCGALSEQDATQLLHDEARERGVRLDPRAASVLVERLGTGRAELLAGLDRAAAHAGEAAITLADVESVAVDVREVDIFALTDAIGRQDHRRALALLATVFRNGERDAGAAMRIFSMLVWQMRRLCVAKFAANPQQAIGGKPFAVRKLQEQARGFRAEQLQRAYAGLARMDADLKGGSRLAYHSPYTLLQRWVLETCGALEGVPSLAESRR